MQEPYERLKLILAYDGSDFCGWQVQAGTPLRTVQGCVEQALSTICSGPIRLYGAGRTDSGVHALAQVAHVDIPAPSSAKGWPDWKKSLNALLPEDIVVLEACSVPNTFHARKDALAKTYVYSLCCEKYLLPQRRRYVWAVGPLHVEAMTQAATHLTGTQDFAAFQNIGTPIKKTIRTISSIEQKPGTETNEHQWHFTGNGFLKQMVRNMMGLLVAVGKERLCPEDVPAIIAKGNRSKAPYATAPAHGLTLRRVYY